MLRNGVHYSEAEQTIAELRDLLHFGRDATSTLKVEDLFERFIRRGLKMLRARGRLVTGYRGSPSLGQGFNIRYAILKALATSGWRKTDEKDLGR